MVWRSVRIPLSIWSDPDWIDMTAEEQLFALACMAIGATGPCTDARIHRHTGWDLDGIRARRAAVAKTAYAHVLTGRTKRRPMDRRLAHAVKERDGWRCVKCGSTDHLQIDHIHPVARGGSDDFDNLQTLCRSCNLAKGTSLA